MCRLKNYYQRFNNRKCVHDTLEKAGIPLVFDAVIARGNAENKIEIKSDHIVSDDYGKKGNVETWKQRKTYSHMPD